MAKKDGEQSPEESFAEMADGLREYAEALEEYSRAGAAEDKKRIAGELHLTSPRTAASVKAISKYLEEMHG